MDKKCENCRFCIYAKSMWGKEEPYCKFRGKWIGDTILCSEWEAVIVPKPATNYDRLIRKTPEELAHWIDEHECASWCPDNPRVDMETKECLENDGECWKCVLDWLKEEGE